MSPKTSRRCMLALLGIAIASMTGIALVSGNSHAGVVTQAGPRLFTSSSSSSSSSSSGGGPPMTTFTWEGGTLGSAVTGTGIFAFDTVYSNTQVFAGTRSAKMHVDAGAEGFGTWGLEYTYSTTLQRFDEIWTRFRIYFPAGFNFAASPRLKFLRYHTQTSGGANKGWVDVYIESGDTSSVGNFWFNSEPANGLNGEFQAGPSTGFTRGQWHTVEYYVKFDTVGVASGGQARARVWKENTIQMDVDSIETMDATTDQSDRQLWFTTWNGNAPTTQDAWIDNVEIYTSRTGAPTNNDGAGHICICGAL